MDAEGFKNELLSKKVQVILIGPKGNILESDNSLIPLQKGTQIQEAHPFFEGINFMVSPESTKVHLPCVNLEVEQQSFVVDIDLIHKKDHIIVVIFDFTAHYLRSHPIVQQKNENAILAQRLILDKALLHEKEQLKNTFLAKLSHELRKPLSNMMGFVSLLQDTSLGYDQVEMLKIVRKTGVHLEDLLNDLLDISRISEGKLELKQVTFKLKDVTKHLQELFEITSKSKRLDFSIEIHDRVPEVLIGDPTRLKQILINLLDNAFRNTKNGSVSLAISLNYMRAKKATLLFKIEDTGYGMDPIQIPKIFDSYYQVDNLLSQTSGEGLGLKIVSDLVQLQDGKIKVNSQKGKGSEFHVSLPYEIPLRPEKKQARKKDIQVDQPMKVLFIDDAELDQMLIMKILISQGYISMDLAMHGEMALQLLDLKTYDVLLVDLDLPVMDGLTFIKTIRKERKYKKLPIVVLTAVADPKTKKEAEALKVSAYLTKPFIPKELVAALKKARSKKEE